MSIADKQTFTLGGREFKAVNNSTIEHDYCVMDKVRAAGLDNLEMSEDMHPSDFAKELLTRLYRSGELFSLISCFIIPVGVKSIEWNKSLASETEAFIKTLHEPSDKEFLNALAAEMLIGFFSSGLVSLTISPSFSKAQGQ